VFVLGGTGAISQAIEDQLEAGGLAVTRLAGASRYATAVAVARHLGAGAASPDALFLATGLNFPDALSAGAAAGSYWLGGAGAPGGAVLLTTTTMPPEVSAYLAEARAANPTVRISAVGGSAAAVAATALPAGSFQRLVGADRYTTAAYVAESHFGAQTAVAVATGTGFADALSGGVLAARLNAPLLLTLPTGLPGGETSGYVHWFSGSISDAVVFGGSGAVSPSVVAQLQAAIGIGTQSLGAAGLDLRRRDLQPQQAGVAPH
jgi:putative cell wall-binding protein